MLQPAIKALRKSRPNVTERLNMYYTVWQRCQYSAGTHQYLCSINRTSQNLGSVSFAVGSVLVCNCAS